MTVNEALRQSFPGVYAHISESGGTLFMQHLIVSDTARSKSLLSTGVRVARALAQYADARQMPVVVTAERVEGFETDNRQLELFYRKFDFQPCTILGENAMIRYPEEPKTYGEENYPDGVSA